MTTPFFHMALGLLTGILLTSTQSPLPVKIVWAALMVGCYALHLQPRDNRLFARTTLTTFGIGVILYLLNLGFGGGNAGLPESLRSQRLTLYGTIDAPVEGNRKTDRLYLALNRAEWRGRSVPLSGRARLTVYQKGVSVQYGDRVRIRNVRLHPPRGFQNPGSFDYETYLAVRGIVAVGAVSRLSQIATLKGGALSLRSELYDFRKRLIQTVRAGLPAPESQVLNAILFGERRDIPSEIRSAFRDSGAGHLLAISGLHVGFVAVFLHQVLFWTVQWIPRRIRVGLPAFLIPARAATLGVLPLVLAYMVIAGARVSTVRATVMVGAYLVARFLQRERNHFNTLGLAAILILLWDPRFLFDTGFSTLLRCRSGHPGVPERIQPRQSNSRLPPNHGSGVDRDDSHPGVPFSPGQSVWNRRQCRADPPRLAAGSSRLDGIPARDVVAPGCENILFPGPPAHGSTDGNGKMVRGPAPSRFQGAAPHAPDAPRVVQPGRRLGGVAGPRAVVVGGGRGSARPLCRCDTLERLCDLEPEGT